MFNTETTALASIMLYPYLLSDCGFEIISEDFQEKQNQVIYLSLLDLVKRGIPTTPTNIYNSLKAGNQHLQVDSNYLSSLPKYAEPSVQVLESFKEDAVGHKLESFAYSILTEGKAGSRGFDALTTAINRLQNYQKSVTKNNHNASLKDAVQAVLYNARNPIVTSGPIYSPWSKINDVINSFMGGEILTIGARPGMGKTHILIQLLEFVATIGHGSGIISTEMNFHGLGKRFIEVNLGIPTKAFRGNKIKEEQLAYIETNIGNFNLNVDLAFVPSTTEEEVLQHIRRMVSEGRRVIVIDYLQSINFGKNPNWDMAIGNFYKAVKGICLEHDVFAIIVSQLGREVEKSKMKKPDLMTYFKGSGFIESHSDMVWSLWRPEYYGYLEDASGKSMKGKLRVFGLKGRDGVQFSYVDLNWDGKKYVDKIETIDYEADF